MKKLLALMFTFALAFTLAMPVFAQDAAAGGTASQDSAAPKKEKKADAMAPKSDETK